MDKPLGVSLRNWHYGSVDAEKIQSIVFLLQTAVSTVANDGSAGQSTSTSMPGHFSAFFCQ